jgi:protein-tyrosine phosphatase
VSDAPRAGPLPGSYWVVPGRFLAGRYPASEELQDLRAAGVDSFVDLTAPGEEMLAPYEEDLAGASYRRFPVPDFGHPSPESMAALLDLLEDELGAGRVVYLHCRFGIGRTGTVVGCHLVRGGRSGEDALAAIAAWRGDGLVPETEAQRELVLGWDEARARKETSREA